MRLTTWDGQNMRRTGYGRQVRRKGHLNLCWDELNKIPEVDFPHDDIKLVGNWLTNSKVVTPDVVVYTDGSRMDNISGCAFAASVKATWLLLRR